MKSLLTLVFLLFLASIGFSQVNVYPTTGSLTIYDYSPSILLQRNTNIGGFTQGIQTRLMNGTDNWYFGAFLDQWIVSKGNHDDIKLIVSNSGNVGLGTTTPQSKLHVYQPVADQVGLIVQGNTINTDFAPHYVAITLDGDYGNATGNYSQIRSYSNLYSSWGSSLAFYTTTSSGPSNTLVERMYINAFGNVGIGTNSPKEKLSVNGNIRAKEIKVETNNWPDYVFAKDYVLPTLAETEKHIKEKGHLQGIPSATEVKENGVELGEMNKLLLKKVEELTLYLIQKDKEMAELLNRVKLLEENRK
ncbi:hypothetical protein [Pedobacter nototheniae]|uniref:hypothetical protein n=1 Tax=Pedobacter nototheniae TaxID=2488994 RepID=UPI00103C16B6|nr:hypothetical protein [Pedobacter nototheniae]